MRHLNRTNIATLEGSFLEDAWASFSGSAKKVASGAGDYAKAQASAVVIGSLTGVQPTVYSNPDGTYTLTFQGSEKDRAVDGLNTAITAMRKNTDTAANPGVKYDFSGVIVPVILRQAAPYLALAVAGGAVGFWLYKQNKKKG